MSSCKITLNSFYEWLQAEDKDLFENLTLPEGIDKNTLVGNIIMRGGEFEVLYSNPFFMSELIGVWSTKWYRTFNKWITALSLEYAPLENYDRHEDYTDTTNKGIKTSARRDSGNTRSFTNYKTISEREVSAFDSSTYQPSEKDTTEQQGSVSDNYGEGTSGSETENNKFIHGGRIHGNIGVTTSQQMLESELDISKWNIYEHITDIFLEEFIIPIYS